MRRVYAFTMNPEPAEVNRRWAARSNRIAVSGLDLGRAMTMQPSETARVN